jgi:hypothetical protein
MRAPMPFKIIVALTFPLMGAFAEGKAEQGHYNDSMYRQAILHQGTNKEYVLITVVDKKTGSAHLVAVLAASLLWAIEREQTYFPTADSPKAAAQVALSRSDRRFSFSDAGAGRNVSRIYDEAVLSELRALLSSKNNEQLIQELRGAQQHSELHKIYRQESGDKYYIYRSALAHVLLERGIMVGIDQEEDSIHHVRQFE